MSQAAVGVGETQTAVHHVAACLNWSRVQVNSQLVNFNFELKTCMDVDPGVPGYCSESYPGNVCLVVCARGRNNVPVCQVYKSSFWKEEKFQILWSRRTGVGLTSPGARSMWRAALARSPPSVPGSQVSDDPCLRWPRVSRVQATAPWITPGACAPSSVPEAPTSGPAAAQTAPGRHTPPVRWHTPPPLMILDRDYILAGRCEGAGGRLWSLPWPSRGKQPEKLK